MSTTPQHWVEQDASNRLQPCAILPAPAQTQPLLLAYEHSTPEQLSAAAVKLLATYGRVKVYPKNTLLIYVGTPSPACYVVLSGRIRVYVSAASGKELTLMMPGLGEPFGDLGLIEEAPYMGTAVTLTPSTLVVVPRACFLVCLAEHPDLAMQFLRLATQRIDHLTSLAKSLAFADVHSRITALLSALAQEREGALVVEQRLTHQEIADMIGATRETVCRVMKELYGSGCIALENGQIRVVAYAGHPSGTLPYRDAGGAGGQPGRYPSQ